MRRSMWVCLVVCVGAGAASTVPLLTASAQEAPDEQGVSQGSIVSSPQAELSEGPSPGYSQVVDNDTEGRFDAPPGWSERSGVDQYGTTYAYSGGPSSAAPARFMVEVPVTGTYSVYARWPAREGNSATARVGVSTTAGIEWTEVDQRTNGGFWVELGAYEMEAGDSYAVQVAHSTGGSGEVVADAVMVLSGERANPDEVAGEDTTLGADGRRVTGRDVVRKARTHFKTPYVASPPGRCKAYRKEDCSCHTKVVFRKFGRSLPDNLVRQWKMGKRVKKRSSLRLGDLVFFDENKNGRLTPWDHVGIYSGQGNVIHASSYFGEVTESKMKRIDGYWGARRIKGLR